MSTHDPTATTPTFYAVTQHAVAGGTRLAPGDAVVVHPTCPVLPLAIVRGRAADYRVDVPPGGLDIDALGAVLAPARVPPHLAAALAW